MNKKIMALLLSITMMAMLMAGCGSSNKPAAKQDAKPMSKLIIAYTPWTGYGALLVAAEKGIFKKHGLDVEIQSIEGVGDRKQALVANRIQAMATSLDVSVAAAGEGVPIKIVWAFDSSNGADGLIVKKSIGAEKIIDLKGKEIALHKGSTSHFFMTTLLEKQGMKDTDIKIVDMKASEAASAFMAGRVDGAVTWEPHLSKAAASGEKILATTKDTPGVIADVLLIREDITQKNPETVQALVNALAEATEYLQKNPDEANKIMATSFKMKPEDVNADSKAIIFYGLTDNKAFFGTKDKKGPAYEIAANAVKFYTNQKTMEKAPDLMKIIDSSFIDKAK